MPFYFLHAKSYLVNNGEPHNIMSFIGKIQNDYEQLWRYIIRPARCPYP
jgi:hypothetical protein